MCIRDSTTDDLDQLYAALGGDDTALDLNADGSITGDDIDQWLSEAGEALGFDGPVLSGDATLDGSVTSLDLNEVGVNWQQSATSWSQGDFNWDGVVDSNDLNEVGINWQQSNVAAAAQSVPEPSAFCLVLLAMVGVMRRRK